MNAYSVDRQAAQIRRRDELIHRLWQLVIALGLIIIVLAVMILSMTRQAGAATSCMTKREAREEWPRSRIYKRSGCWGTRASLRYGKRQRHIAPDDIPEEATKAVAGPVPKSAFDVAENKPISPSVMYPNIKRPVLNVDPRLLEPQPSTLSYRLLDIDELTATNNDGLPECCWPQLFYDDKGNPWIK